MTYDPDPVWTQSEFIKSHDGDYLPKKKVDSIHINEVKSVELVESRFTRKQVLKSKHRLTIDYCDGDSYDWEFNTREEAVEARENLAKQLNIK